VAELLHYIVNPIRRVIDSAESLTFSVVDGIPGLQRSTTLPREVRAESRRIPGFRLAGTWCWMRTVLASLDIANSVPPQGGPTEVAVGFTIAGGCPSGCRWKSRLVRLRLPGALVGLSESATDAPSLDRTEDGKAYEPILGGIICRVWGSPTPIVGLSAGKAPDSPLPRRLYH